MISTPLVNTIRQLSKFPMASFSSSAAKSGNYFESQAYKNRLKLKQQSMDDSWIDFKKKNTVPFTAMARKSRDDGFSMVSEDQLGGHIMDRHYKHNQLKELEDRVMGKSKVFPQSRSALRFDNSRLADSEISAALLKNKLTFQEYFQKNDAPYEFDHESDRILGSGYTNIGTQKNPESEFVMSKKLKMILMKDQEHEDGYRVHTAYPSFVPEKQSPFAKQQ